MSGYNGQQMSRTAESFGWVIIVLLVANAFLLGVLVHNVF